MKRTLIVLVCLLAVNDAVRADEPAEPVQKTFDRLIGAIKANKRDDFIVDAIDAVKQGVTQQVMDGLAKQLGARLDKGYKAAYLCELKQAGLRIHLWKLTFKDGGDDIVVRIAINKGGKVEGFFLQ